MALPICSRIFKPTLIDLVTDNHCFLGGKKGKKVLCENFGGSDFRSVLQQESKLSFKRLSGDVTSTLKLVSIETFFVENGPKLQVEQRGDEVH